MTSPLFCPLEPAWGDVATWVSGIATLLTAGLAIYLAKRPERIRLKAQAGFYLLLGTDTVGDPPEILSVTATNVGLRRTTIKQISIRTGLMKRGPWRHRFALIPNWVGAFSSPLPMALADGDSGSWNMAMEPGRPFVARLVTDGFVRSWVDVWTFRFGIHTGHGGNLYIKPSSDFRKALSEALRGKQ